MNLISFGRWYYDHASTSLGVLYHQDGSRADWGKVEIALEKGESVIIRPATRAEHNRMIALFDARIDEMAKQGWVHGLGNFDPGEAGAPSQQTIDDRVAAIKADARAWADKVAT